jgi:hypothetical protein
MRGVIEQEDVRQPKPQAAGNNGRRRSSVELASALSASPYPGEHDTCWLLDDRAAVQE